MTYLTDSDTTKNAGIGLISIQIPGIGAALHVSKFNFFAQYSGALVVKLFTSSIKLEFLL